MTIDTIQWLKLPQLFTEIRTQSVLSRIKFSLTVIMQSRTYLYGKFSTQSESNSGHILH